MEKKMMDIQALLELLERRDLHALRAALLEENEVDIAEFLEEMCIRDSSQGDSGQENFQQEGLGDSLAGQHGADDGVSCSCLLYTSRCV